MKVILRPRAGGKTVELIKIANKRRYSLLVVHSREEAHRVFNLARTMDCPIPLPITYAEFINKAVYGRNIDSFLIDNVEMFLQSLSHVPVEAFTVTLSENTTISPYLDDVRIRELGIEHKKRFNTEPFGEWIEPEKDEKTIRKTSKASKRGI